MPASRRAAALAVAVLAALPLLSLTGPAEAGTDAGIVRQDVVLTMRDGVRLSGRVARPVGEGPFPLVVRPGTFGGEEVDTTFADVDLARRGYVTVAYTERGLGRSGGLLDGGGPADVADMSQVIDWALASTPADPDRVGALGLSYGGGISLITAAFDPRLKVVADISGWVDLGNAVYQNRTRAIASLNALSLVGGLVGRLSPETQQRLDDAKEGRNIEAALEWARVRSAASYLGQYTQGRPAAPAIFMSHSMNETLAPIDATRRFYEAYPGPKRWDLRSGDHGAQELVSQFGITPVTYHEAYRWLDAWLLGRDDGIRSAPPVHVVPRSHRGARPAEDLADTVVRRSRRQYLTDGGLFGGGTRLSDVPGTGSTRVQEGLNLLLHVPIPEFSYTQEVWFGTPLSAPLAFVDRRVTAVWTGAPLRGTLRYRGEAVAHLRATPSAAKGTLQVYLLDVDPLGTAYIVAQVPYTFLGATPGKPLDIDVAVPFNAYDLPAGHRLGVAVSMGDPTYASENPPLATITVQPGSYVDVPLGTTP